MADKPFYLSAGISICSLLAAVAAGIQYCMMKTGFIKLPSHIVNAPGETYTNLQHLWHTRFVRRMVSVLVRSSFRRSVLRLVHFNIDLPANSGCIFITCHTPWKRLLTQWCIENKFALIITADKNANMRKRIQRFGSGFHEMREILSHLRNKGRIVIVADSFNNLNNCPVQFLEHSQNVSLLPIRLARAADVPVIITIPSFKNGTVNINAGPPFDLTHLNGNLCNTMQQLVGIVENEIKKDPCIFR